MGTGLATLGVCVLAAVQLWRHARVWRTQEPQMERAVPIAAA